MPTDNSETGPELIARKAARSLAMHALIAQKVTDNPALLERARANLERWGAAQNSEPTAQWLTEWQEILNRPWPEIAALITGQGQENDRLRKSTPFVGILSPEERLEIFERFKASNAAGTEWLAANAAAIATYNLDVEVHGTFAAALPRPAEDPEDVSPGDETRYQNPG